MTAQLLAGARQIGGVHVGLDLDQGDRGFGERAVGEIDPVQGVLPALVAQPPGRPGRVEGPGARYAVTRRATKVARNTWPVIASMTATERPPFSAAVKSPYPRVVSVVKLKYW